MASPLVITSCSEVTQPIRYPTRPVRYLTNPMRDVAYPLHAVTFQLRNQHTTSAILSTETPIPRSLLRIATLASTLGAPATKSGVSGSLQSF
eukprot:1012039-Rhodomonas_salina.2